MDGRAGRARRARCARRLDYTFALIACWVICVLHSAVYLIYQDFGFLLPVLLSLYNYNHLECGRPAI
jgi:hypothetical protein